MRAGFVFDRQRQEGFDPIAILVSVQMLGGVFIVPGGHRKQVADAHFGQVGVGFGRRFVGKKDNSKSSTVRRPSATARPTAEEVKPFAEREEHVRLRRGIRRPPTFGHHAAMPQQHQAVHLGDLLQAFNQGQQGGR